MYAGGGAPCWLTPGLDVTIVVVVSEGRPYWEDIAMNVIPHMIDQIQPRRKIITVANCNIPTKKLQQKVATTDWPEEPGFAMPHKAKNPARIVPNPGRTKLIIARMMATAGCTADSKIHANKPRVSLVVRSFGRTRYNLLDLFICF